MFLADARDMDTGTTTSLDHGVPSIPTLTLRDAGEFARELEALAEALPFLIARDDERPPLWLSMAFAAQVAAVRSRVSSIATHRGLAMRLRFISRSEHVEVGRFETAARRLAADAASVAFAIRWLEISADTRLPSWPELLRRQSSQSSASNVHLDAALWFG
jgi:hypothetical protein